MYTLNGLLAASFFILNVCVAPSAHAGFLSFAGGSSTGRVSEQLAGQAPTVTDIFPSGSDGSRSGAVQFTTESGLEVSASGGTGFTNSSSNLGAGIAPGSQIAVSGVPNDSNVTPTISMLLVAGHGAAWKVPDPWLTLSIAQRNQLWEASTLLFPSGRYTISGNVAPGDKVNVSASVLIQTGIANAEVLKVFTPGITIEEEGEFSFSDSEAFSMTPAEFFGSGFRIQSGVSLFVDARVTIQKGDSGLPTTVRFNPPQAGVFTPIPEPRTLYQIVVLLLIAVPVGGRVRYLSVN